MSELENTNVNISLKKVGIFETELSKKTTTMRGIFDFERLKTDMLLTDPVTKDKYYTSIEGFVNIDNKVKFKQRGENVSLHSTKRYLVINIMKVEKIKPAETKGIVDSFISIEWVER